MPTFECDNVYTTAAGDQFEIECYFDDNSGFALDDTQVCPVCLPFVCDEDPDCECDPLKDVKFCDCCIEELPEGYDYSSNTDGSCLADEDCEDTDAHVYLCG